MAGKFEKICTAFPLTTFNEKHLERLAFKIFAGLSSFGFDCGNFFPNLSWKTISAMVNFKRLLCVIVACERFSFWKPLLDNFWKRKKWQDRIWFANVTETGFIFSVALSDPELDRMYYNVENIIHLNDCLTWS